MPRPPLPKEPRRVVALAVWLVLAALGLKLAACSGPLDPTPPVPHEMPDPHEMLPDGDPPADAGDASDGAP